MNMNPSIFSGGGVLEQRGALGNDRIFTAPADPLVGIPTLLDLRTHRGNKVPFGINPITNGTNALWQGVTGFASQATPTQQPLTKFATDGTPYLDFDGVNDWMSVGIHGGKATYTILVRSKQEGSYGVAYSSFCDLVEGGLSDRWGLIEANGLQMHFNPSPTSVRFNQEILSQPTATFPGNTSDWNVLTIETYPALETGVERGICRGANFLSAEIIAFFLHDGDPSTERVEAVENHFMTLKPDPLVGIPMLMHLKTSEGFYKDAAFTEPATEDGDLIYHWRDENTGAFVSQSNPAYRPILKIDPSGRRWLDFYPQKTLANHHLPIIGDMGWATLAKFTSDVKEYGRVLSFRTPSLADFDSFSTICAVLRIAGSDAVGAYYYGSQGGSSVTLGEWFTDVTSKTSSRITVQINDLADQVTEISGNLNSSIVVIGGQDVSVDSWSSPIADIMIGPWTTSQTARVRQYIESLRAAIS